MKKIASTLIFCFSLFFVRAQTGCLHGDCQNGNGTYKLDNGDTYTGEWVNGARTGYGRYDWNDGSYYVGNFKNNLLDGEGSYYAADGTSMIGYFEENTFMGKDKPAGNDYTAADDEYGDDYSSLDSLLDAYDKIDEENEAARSKALTQANYYDFATTMQMVINQFANNFDNLRGPESKGIFDFGNTWYSNILVKGTNDAMISEALLSDNNTWYNVLCTGTDFNDVKRKYEFYVQQFNDNVRTSCCTLVYDKYDDYKTESYESYGTYWLTFLVNDGYDEDIYTDLLVEIEMSSSILGGGYEVLVRVSHESDAE